MISLAIAGSTWNWRKHSGIPGFPGFHEKKGLPKAALWESNMAINKD
jgi:hypothetical protein